MNGAFGNHLGSQLNGQLSSCHGIKIDNSILAPNGVNEPYARWFGDGIDCEMLNLGSKSWKKGKVRIKVSLEFYVEEQEDSQTLGSDALEISPPESPLDDLRQMINKENQQ
ncbi:KGK family protein [Microcoleus sp. FACHB-53]|nr:KGK family protein [Microcoleus sp. FACHB-53]